MKLPATLLLAAILLATVCPVAQATPSETAFVVAKAKPKSKALAKLEQRVNVLAVEVNKAAIEHDRWVDIYNSRLNIYNSGSFANQTQADMFAGDVTNAEAKVDEMDRQHTRLNTKLEILVEQMNSLREEQGLKAIPIEQVLQENQAQPSNLSTYTPLEAAQARVKEKPLTLAFSWPSTCLAETLASFCILQGRMEDGRLVTGPQAMKHPYLSP